MIPGIENITAFWDFQEPAGGSRISKGAAPLALREMAGPVQRVEGGLFGPYAAALEYGQFFAIPRAECPELDICGPDAMLTLVAWIQRRRKPEIQCEAIAGMWNETACKRQYALFLDLRIFGSADQIGAHVSSSGGVTPGHKYCMDAAIGQTCVEYHPTWEMVGFTYDSEMVRVYRNGLLDERPGRNPFSYPDGLLCAGSEGADFAVGAVPRGHEMGNFFAGLLGGLLVLQRPLAAEQMLDLARQTVPEKIETTREAIARGAAQYDTIKL